MASSSSSYPIVFQPPPDVSAYDVRRRPEDQTPAARAALPPTYLDAMIVRYAVFVEEQKVPAESELDEDDPRCCYWVLYAEEGQGKKPVGTVRLVPYPHAPHPVPGGEYRVENGVMELKGLWKGPDRQHMVPPTAENIRAASGVTTDGDGDGDGDGTGGGDRKTSLHDGREPYVKIGRMAVDAAFRQRGLARLLVEALLAWVRANPTYFDKDGVPSGFDGLVCVHAQVQAAPFYERLGFVVDEGMGRWWEENMEHCGMFLRVKLDK